MWQVDIAINTAKMMIPFRSSLRALVRSTRGYPITLNAPLALDQGLDQISDLRALGIEVSGQTVLDIGTGWHPIVPLLYRIAGASHIYLTDTERLLDSDTVVDAANWISQRAEEIAARLGLNPETVQSRVDVKPGPLKNVLAGLSMDYLVPFDPSATPPVDLIVSRVVLEHIEPAVLARMHAAFVSALRPNGRVAHIVDNSDHREHRDKRVSRIGFLQYHEPIWRLLCLNRQDYCNRLRHSDHVRLLRDAGFELLLERGEVDARAIADASTIGLAAPWRAKPIEDLAIMTSHLVARVAAGIDPNRKVAGA